VITAKLNDKENGLIVFQAFGRKVMRSSSLMFSLTVVVFGATAAQAQYTER
jgi:hypothetical protein